MSSSTNARPRIRPFAVRLSVVVLASIFVLVGYISTTAAQEDAPGTQEDNGITTTEEGATEGAPADDEGEGLITEDGVTGTGPTISSADGTIDPDLRLERADIELVNLDNEEQEFVRLTFTERIQGNADDIDPGSFFVQGADPEQLAEGETVQLVHNRPRQLLVGFAAGTDLLSYTSAGAGHGVIENTSGDANIASIVGLEGGTANVIGRTTSPELQAVDVDASLNRVTYEFDEFVENGDANASEYSFLLASGAEITGEDVIALDDNRVTIGFGDGSGAQLEKAEQFVAGNGAATDEAGNESVIGSIGAPTALPDLVSVTRNGNSQWTFSFDEPVREPEAGSFHLYSVDGDVYDGEIANLTDPRNVLVTFSEVRDFADQIVIAAADRGAVSDLGTEGDESTAGSEPVGSTRLLGTSSGPDIDRVTANAEANQLSIIWDERIDEDQSVNASDFAIVTTGGALVEATSVITLDDDERLVRLEFPESALETRAALVVQPEAVVDESDNPNVLQSVTFAAGAETEGVLGAAEEPGEAPAVSDRLGADGCAQAGFSCK